MREWEWKVLSCKKCRKQTVMRDICVLDCLYNMLYSKSQQLVQHVHKRSKVENSSTTFAQLVVRFVVRAASRQQVELVEFGLNATHGGGGVVAVPPPAAIVK